MTGFILARSDRVLRTSGVRERFADVELAADAVRSGRIPLLVGAIAFDPRKPAALHVPDSWHRGALDLPAGSLPTVHMTGETPSPAEHVARVARLVRLLADGEMRKVVSARSVQLTADAPIDPNTLVEKLIRRHPSSNAYSADLTGAGPQHDGAFLVGSSPELLISRHGRELTLRPLAGTAPRRPDPADDRAEADDLLASAKNLEEHSYVIDWIREKLTPICGALRIPDGPVLVSTPEVWHLATPISGELHDPSTTALDVAALLHPTPAMCGTPTAAALDTITDIEEDRGFYGGAVGWCDDNGDGDWIVAIRCAEIAADGRHATAYAGGGIVAASDPAAELDETTTKLRTLLGALNVAI